MCGWIGRVLLDVFIVCFNFCWMSSQLFHEEVALQWIFVHMNAHIKNLVLKNSWFFFEMMVSAATYHTTFCAVDVFVLCSYQLLLMRVLLCLDQRDGSAFESHQ